MPFKNKSDRSKYHREYYNKNKSRYQERNRNSVTAKQDFLRSHKDRPCADCNERYPYFVMDLHHIDETTKRYAPNRLAIDAGWKALRDELKKCVVLCSNCHRIRTHQNMRLERD